MKEFFETVKVAIEVASVLLLVIGALLAMAAFLIQLSQRRNWVEAFDDFRRNLGRTLLLALEFLIAADVIGTVAVEQTFASLGQLGLLVLIRTFLSFSLELEVNGRWPWQPEPVAEAPSNDEST